MTNTSTSQQQRQPISERLQDWRKTKGFTQELAAEYLGVNLWTIKNWEQGKSQPVGIGMAALLAALSHNNNADLPNDFHRYSNKTKPNISKRKK